jgi:nitrite reductase/ring-hydroxylating ferredoxin subunit
VPHPIAKTSEIPAGTAKRVVVDGVEVLLCNVDGAFYAVTSGAALSLPAVVPLPTYAVHLDGDDISVEV